MCLVLILVAIGLLFAGGYLALIGTAFALALVPWLVVGLIVGAVANAVTESHLGVLSDIVVGLAGSVVGGVLFVLLFHHRPGLFSLQGLLMALVGAVVLLLVLRLFRTAA
jgi:uncharacterized membrane protein YeaQ/YmgE (transglycosylase-associated protein family)